MFRRLFPTKPTTDNAVIASMTVPTIVENVPYNGPSAGMVAMAEMLAGGGPVNQRSGDHIITVGPSHFLTGDEITFKMTPDDLEPQGQYFLSQLRSRIYRQVEILEINGAPLSRPVTTEVGMFEDEIINCIRGNKENEYGISFKHYNHAGIWKSKIKAGLPRAPKTGTWNSDLGIFLDAATISDTGYDKYTGYAERIQAEKEFESWVERTKTNNPDNADWMFYTIAETIAGRRLADFENMARGLTIDYKNYVQAGREPENLSGPASLISYLPLAQYSAVNIAFPSREVSPGFVRHLESHGFKLNSAAIEHYKTFNPKLVSKTTVDVPGGARPGGAEFNA